MLVSVDRFVPFELFNRKKFKDVGEFKGSPTEKLNCLSCNNELVSTLRNASARWSKAGITNEIYVEVEDFSLLYVTRIMIMLVFPWGYSYNLKIDLTKTYPYMVILDTIARTSSVKSSGLLHSHVTSWVYIFRMAVCSNETLALNSDLLLGGL